MVPETHHAVTHSFQPGRAPGIVCGLFRMLSPVDFDDQSGFQANEVHDIRFNYALAAELETRQLTVTQVPPEQPLGIACRRRSFRARVVRCFVDPLTLSLSRGEREPFV